jgi:hypothetical protein
MLKESVLNLENSSTKLISQSCHNLDMRMDGLIENHLSVNELIGKDCQFATMSEWAKNFTSSTNYNFETVNSTISTLAETSHTSLMTSESKLLETVEETK